MKKKFKLREWFSVLTEKHPRHTVLLLIALFNLIFMIISATVITYVARSFRQDIHFFGALYYTISMILDAGCISYVIESADQAGAIATIICILIVLIGMISFTGSIIGYISNLISGFIDHAGSGKRKLRISDHTVILNWNSRASEIVNDMLFSNEKEIIVILVNENKELIEKELHNRLNTTIAMENRIIENRCPHQNQLYKKLYMFKNSFKNKLTVIIREGDTFSQTQLLDICVDQAKTVIILNRDMTDIEYLENVQLINKGNAVMVKTLVLVSEITSEEQSSDHQKIIVEVDDEWTYELVDKIIRHKEKIDKCNIIPVSANRILGQLLSQFSIMPDLNKVYSILFSKEGAEFFFKDEAYYDISQFLKKHQNVVPLTTMDTKTGKKFFYIANEQDEIDKIDEYTPFPVPVQVNPDYWLPKRNILILGHNSKMSALMNEFQVFMDEWGKNAPYTDSILNIGIIDDEESMMIMNHYKKYPFINQNYVVSCDIYSQKMIYDTIDNFFDQQDGSTCVLILSDDSVQSENVDSAALTYLIYLQDLLENRKIRYGGKDIEEIEIVVEIINPANYDVARSYNVDNVVITNRYISKMITQVGQKEALYEFYTDILTYDSNESKEFNSKELYLKYVQEYLLEIPPVCKAIDLIYSIYLSSKMIDQNNETILLGYIKSNGQMILFSGNLKNIQVSLEKNDRLILFSNH